MDIQKLVFTFSIGNMTPIITENHNILGKVEPGCQHLLKLAMPSTSQNSEQHHPVEIFFCEVLN